LPASQVLEQADALADPVRLRAGSKSRSLVVLRWNNMVAKLARSQFGSSKRISAEAVESGRQAARYIDGETGGSTVRRLRSHERYCVNIKALLHLRDRFQTTKIRDVSIGGACLEGAYAVAPGDRIVLQLNNGRTLNAAVKWWACGRCGIAFENALMANDPILIEGATGRRSRPDQTKDRMTFQLA